MKRNRLVAATAASTITLALTLTACSSESEAPAESEETTAAEVEPGDITLWVAGGDTPEPLREYLVETFESENPGSSLTIEQQDWTDLVTKLTTALPDAANTPDVVELGNTQAPTFTYAGAFREISPELYEELGGENLLQSFVDAGSVDDTVYALPYYFGSRYMFYRADVWEKAGVEVPTTLEEFGTAVNELKTKNMSGFALGGQDWRNGISWVFANGGELAVKEGDQWVSTLSDPNTVAGLEQWQDVYSASNLPATERDVAYWDFLNDAEDGGDPAAATIMAPGWARWSIGDLTTNDDGDEVRDGMADESKFDIFALPGVDGGLAPVFAGGSNLAISAQSQHPELSENLLRIIYSEEYQTLLAENGLGPANTEYTDVMATDKFGEVTVETAKASKLTPAAPGWAAIEGAFVYEELFQKIAEGGDVTALATEYDEKLTPMLNGQAG
ncbi:carbohydrate ABC transporter substrate-binding protein (CUT1 family) [Isoptericola jiangsuensis]|uniref:Carbohydrate ABC transporter substrate-binding protein (CUT1 family) n=1 Tax=Isoptericola jiangsuensis TaxID=548579 RepID=A0A2A9EUL3_9MICO|nr:extracellular solute-binding protein [Isoptericola jiangsuensis]PFG42568.1 carbohydrate ABC transporter substrate-binding protein (CUT1 family) [Isoptericola jiangsuensis]